MVQTGRDPACRFAASFKGLREDKPAKDVGKRPEGEGLALATPPRLLLAGNPRLNGLVSPNGGAARCAFDGEVAISVRLPPQAGQATKLSAASASIGLTVTGSSLAPGILAWASGKSTMGKF